MSSVEDAKEVGQCSGCGSARVQTSARGSRFWRCGLSDDDPSFLRYPPLPVHDCSGFREGQPVTSSDAEAGPRGPAR